MNIEEAVHTVGASREDGVMISASIVRQRLLIVEGTLLEALQRGDPTCRVATPRADSTPRGAEYSLQLSLCLKRGRHVPGNSGSVRALATGATDLVSGDCSRELRTQSW